MRPAVRAGNYTSKAWRANPLGTGTVTCRKFNISLTSTNRKTDEYRVYLPTLVRTSSLAPLQRASFPTLYDVERKKGGNKNPKCAYEIRRRRKLTTNEVHLKLKREEEGGKFSVQDISLALSLRPLFTCFYSPLLFRNSTPRPLRVEHGFGLARC